MMRNRLVLLLLLCFITLPISTLLGADKTLDKKAPLKEQIDLIGITNIALGNSLDIQIAKLDTYISRTSEGKVISMFDFLLDGGISYDDNKKKQASEIFGTSSMINNYSLGLSKKTQFGTDVSINTQYERIDTNSQFETVNPAHEPIAGISLSQSVGKNFFGMADRGSVKVTKIDIENSEYTSLTDIEDAIRNVQIAYWKLVLVYEEINIKKDMLGEAEKLYGIYKGKFNIGTAEMTDLLAMEANVKLRESEILIAYLKKDTTKNDLLFMLNIEDLSLQIVPDNELVTVPENINLSESIARAIENRRDYKQMKNVLKINDIDLSVKKNALWPEIDLQASYSKNGLDTDFNESWNDLFDENNREYMLGLKFSMPLQNNFARADLKEVRYQKQRTILTLKQIESLILRQLNNKYKEIGTICNQIVLFKSLVSLHRTKLEEEEKRQRYGRSNSDLLIRYENDLLAARLSLANYYYQYRIKLVELDSLENVLLDKYWKGEI